MKTRAEHQIKQNNAREKRPNRGTPSKAASPRIVSPVEQILHLQQSIGNRAVTKMIESGTLQAKLQIAEPDDIYEQEADRLDVIQLQPEALAQTRPHLEWAGGEQQNMLEMTSGYPDYMGAYMLNWENTELTDEFQAHLAERIEEFFGESLTLEDVLYCIEQLENNGDAESALEARINLFKANEYAVVDTLNVTASERYQRQGSTTYCNIYAYDVVTAMGGYLPRVWWYPAVVEQILNGGTVPEPVWGQTVEEMNANRLTDWMLEYGQNYFGWRQEDDMTRAQEEANNGKLVILLAAKINPGQSGHVTVLMPETDEHRAVREGDAVTRPLQSQAGWTNYLYQALSVSTWLQDTTEYRDGHAWIFEGTPQSPLVTPEELGRRPDMRLAEVDVNWCIVDSEIAGDEYEEGSVSERFNLIPSDRERLSINRCCGDEVVLKLNINLSLRPRDSSISVFMIAYLYEGTDCQVQEAEDLACFTLDEFIVESGGTEIFDLRLENEELFGGDRAVIRVVIRNTNG